MYVRLTCSAVRVPQCACVRCSRRSNVLRDHRPSAAAPDERSRWCGVYVFSFVSMLIK